MKRTKPHDSGKRGTKPTRRRRTRARTPKWLMESKDFDAMAQRRCLMILSVLSGERSVLEATDEAQITPNVYYEMEAKAVRAMVAALVPGASQSGSTSPHLSQLESKIEQLEKDKRRLERLLFLTRQVVKPGPLILPNVGRPRKRRGPSSTTTGTKRLHDSKKKTIPATPTSSPSTQMPAGTAAPSNGTES